MLGKEAIEAYRRMTPGQRLALTLQAIRESQAYLSVGSPEVVRRRFERMRNENDARNRQMRVKLAEAERQRCQDSMQ